MDFKIPTFSSRVTPKSNEKPIRVINQRFEQSFSREGSVTDLSVSKISLNDVSFEDNSYVYMLKSFGSKFSPTKVAKEEQLKELYSQLKQAEKTLDKRVHAKSR